MPEELIPGKKRTVAYKKSSMLKKISGTGRKPYKMNGHALPGINQRLDNHPKNVAEKGLSGSAPTQYRSPAKHDPAETHPEHHKGEKVETEQEKVILSNKPFLTELGGTYTTTMIQSLKKRGAPPSEIKKREKQMKIDLLGDNQ